MTKNRPYVSRTSFIGAARDINTPTASQYENCINTSITQRQRSISRGGALAQRRGFGTCGSKGVGTPDRRPNLFVGSAAATARVHPEWVRRHGLARRCRIPPRLRKGGAALVLGRLENPSSWAGSTPPMCKTERLARGLDLVARDNPTDSLMAQDRRFLPYPHSTGPGPTRKGVGPTRGRAPASEAGPIEFDTFTRRDAQPSTGHLP
jgi:hypothetical protein